MFFRVEFSTYDSNLIDILKKIKGKKPFLVEKALTHFLASEIGKQTVNALLEEKDKAAGKRKIKEKKVKEKPSKEAKTGKKTGRILIDKFL